MEGDPPVSVSPFARTHNSQVVKKLTAAAKVTERKRTTNRKPKGKQQDSNKDESDGSLLEGEPNRDTSIKMEALVDYGSSLDQWDANNVEAEDFSDASDNETQTNENKKDYRVERASGKMRVYTECKGKTTKWHEYIKKHKNKLPSRKLVPNVAPIDVTASAQDDVWEDSRLFVDGGELKRSQYIHRVHLKDLKPEMRYSYVCGSDLGWSPIFTFKTPRVDPKWSPSFAIFGDMGNENAQSLAFLQREAEQDMYDAIIHVGDFAYDMDSENATIGDEFMNQIQEIAAYVPYMVCAGNHEEKYNFSNYRERFSMPGDSESLWYSFDLGPVHFIGITTEVYYFLNYGIKTLVKQYAWLEKDLQEASKPENRALRPWIIVYGHRPMYCSNGNTADCSEHETLTRVGLPFVHMFGLEDLFYEHGVDVQIWAHEHSYERLFPLYNYTVYNGSVAEPYTNPKAPVHVITGSAGCDEGRTPFLWDRPAWSAFRSTDYGYTRLKAHNETHLYFEQVSVDKKGEIIDSFWIIKDKHVPYTEL